MHTTITARHCDISEELRQRAEAVLARLGNHVSNPLDGTVVFDAANGQLSAEIRLHVAKGDLFLGSGEAADHRTALDRAEERVRIQLDRAPTPGRRGRRVQTDKK